MVKGMETETAYRNTHKKKILKNGHQTEYNNGCDPEEAYSQA